MPIWQQVLLTLYYHGTRPWRAWQRRIAQRAGRCPVLILYYHRVADDAANDWTTPRRLFERQMTWLAAHFDMVSLDEARWRIERGVETRGCASVTFDDGYAANNDFALPLLVERRIPCTYFVTTQAVLAGRPLVHDLGIGRPLETNTIEDLRRWAAAGVEIGSHTRTHADLGALGDPAQLYDEIVGARDELQHALARPVRFFSFPYGQYQHLHPAAFEMAREAGFAAVCSAYGGYNFPGDDNFHLQRFSAERCMVRLKNWATVDPRKVRTPRFDYHTPPAAAHCTGALTS